MKLRDFTECLETAGGNLLLASILILLLLLAVAGVVIGGNRIIKDGAAWLAAGAIFTAFGTLVGVFATLLKGQQKAPGSPQSRPPAVAAPEGDDAHQLTH